MEIPGQDDSYTTKLGWTRQVGQANSLIDGSLFR